MLINYKVHWTPADSTARRTSAVSYSLSVAHERQAELERDGVLDVEIEKITLR
ncbi:hypothetical protein AB8O64_36695 (plasmid) [Streptomyces sp. QH1-20]|uniref:hypothetical protein n=1 Tax=Streptomyces sp. QH1-20 TaxID=3240934 RepID=UPI003516019C